MNRRGFLSFLAAAPVAAPAALAMPAAPTAELLPVSDGWTAGDPFDGVYVKDGVSWYRVPVSSLNRRT